MRFDPDLALAILQELEASDEADGSGALILSIEEWTEREISYHVRLLSQAGFLEAKHTTASGWRPTGLTWDGHAALDAMRSGLPVGRLSLPPEPEDDPIGLPSEKGT